jgi:hypothetical protein
MYLTLIVCSRFAAVPKQSAVLQLYDLQDLHVANIISQTSRALITCDKHTGES